LVVYLPLFTTGFSTIPNGGFLHQISEPSTGTIDDTEKSYQLQNGAFCFKDMFILPTIIFFQGKNPVFGGESRNRTLVIKSRTHLHVNELRWICVINDFISTMYQTDFWIFLV